MILKIKFKLEPLSPMIMHALHPSALRGGAKSGTERIPTPEVEAKMGRYVVPGTDDLCIPGLNLTASFLEGAANFRVARKSARKILGASLLVTPEFAPILDGKGKPLRKYEIHTVPATVQKAKILRSRPIIRPPWSVAAVAELDGQLFGTPEQAWDLLYRSITHAGLYCGLMDWRPSCSRPGPHGRYKLVSFVPEGATGEYTPQGGGVEEVPEADEE